MMPDLFSDQVEPYPAGPGFNDTDTSKAAAASIAGTAPRQAAIILGHITARASTADELELATELRAQSITGRIRQLALAGKVVDTGERRLTRRNRQAIVWGAAPIGHQPPPLQRDIEAEQATGLYRAFHRIRKLGARVHLVNERPTMGGGYRWLVALDWCGMGTQPGLADDPDANPSGMGATMVEAINAACDQAAALVDAQVTQS